VSVRGRVLLGAHVAGPAAVWAFRHLEGKAEDSARYYRGIGRPDVAAAIERAVAELREAGRAWQDAAVSGGGSAEVPPGEVVPGSVSAVVDTPTAAAALALSERRVRQLLAAGLLDGQKVGGRWVVDVDDLQRVRTDRRLTA